MASSVAVEAQSVAATTVLGGAPIGHLQPRAQQFAPGPTAEQAQQQEMSNFDAQEQKLDEELDKRLMLMLTAEADVLNRGGVKGRDGRGPFEEMLK